jgi:hypothetical protein
MLSIVFALLSLFTFHPADAGGPPLVTAADAGGPPIAASRGHRASPNYDAGGPPLAATPNDAGGPPLQ